MSRFDKYVIEKRDASGALVFTGLQPYEVFGGPATTGITDDQMARVIYARNPDVVLDGRYIPSWPSVIDPQFSARRKTW